MNIATNDPREQPDSSKALATRNEFGATEQRFAMVETASSAAASRAKAMVEARYIVAARNPRNWDQVRQDLLSECRRPAFADNKSALYNKPIGKGIEGLGIRFVEVGLRCMRNVLIEAEMIFEDELKEIQRVTVTDLENNSTYWSDVKVGKTVERAKPMDDGSYISVRKNSYGKDTFTVPANDDDLLNKRGALISKALRTLGLRLIPGDLQDEAEDIIRKIRLDKAAKDPAGERKKIADAFAELSVRVTDLEAYLEHKLDTCSPAELVALRGIYGAIRDGEATWKTVMESKNPEPSGSDPGKTPSGRKRPQPKDPKGATTAIDAIAALAGHKDVESMTAYAETLPEAIRNDDRFSKAFADRLVALKARTAGQGQPVPVTKPQLEQIRNKMLHFEISEAEICKAFGIASLEALDGRLTSAALLWAGDPLAPPDLSALKS